jgi:type I restriction enzyme R subunit
VRNIVLLRPINSMIEFKQIIGRGTRLYDGKDYFTIYDFVKAYEHFSDPEWDGEPMEPEPPGKPKPKGEKPPEPPLIDPPEPTPQKLVIKLADGKERTFQHISGTTFWDAAGKPISAQQFVEQLFGKLPELFRDEEELRRIWSDPDTRKALVDGLAERGFAGEQLAQIRRMIDAEATDLFDVLRYIAFTKAPLKRAERAAARRADILSQQDPKQAEFLDFVLSQYVEAGEDELDSEKLPDLLSLKYGTPADALKSLGKAEDVRRAFRGFQEDLYRKD